jgi:hypothetical protein
VAKSTTLVLQVVIALALAGSLVVQTFIVPAVWVDLDGAPPVPRITFVTLLVLGVVTMQVFAVCVWQLLTKVRKGSVFSESSFRYVDVVIWSIAAAAVITFAIAVICGATLVLGGMALLVVVMKTLLRQAIDRETEATALRSELDEVV